MSPPGLPHWSQADAALGAIFGFAAGFIVGCLLMVLA